MKTIQWRKFSAKGGWAKLREFQFNNFIDVEGERKETVENFEKAGNYRMVLQSQVDLGWITNLGKLAGQKSA